MPEITYKQLAKAVAQTAVNSARNAELIRGNAKLISDTARETAQVAEQIGALRVDRATVGETQQLSKIMDGLSDAAIAYASAGDNTSKAAQAAHAANQASHGGINEQVQRSLVGTEIYDLNNQWLTRE